VTQGLIAFHAIVKLFCQQQIRAKKLNAIPKFSNIALSGFMLFAE
jgi:hypothetical protein